jgi:hypothetical protein
MGELGWIVGGLGVGAVAAAFLAPARVLDAVEDAIVLAFVWVTALPMYLLMERRGGRPSR